MLKKLVLLYLLINISISYYEFEITVDLIEGDIIKLLQSNNEEINGTVYINNSPSPIPLEKKVNDDWIRRYQNMYYINYNVKGPVNLRLIIETNLTSFSYAFQFIDNYITSIKLKSVDENLLYMDNMFNQASSLQSVDFTELDLSHVVSFSNLFFRCDFLRTVIFGNSITRNLEEMDYMFYLAYNLKSLDLSNFDTSKVEKMTSVFYNCNSLTSLNIKSFNTKNVKDFESMFEGCNSLVSLDLTNFDTSNALNINSLFYGCENLIFLDVTSFNTSKIKSMEHIFGNCVSLEIINLKNFDTSSVTSMSYMFYGCNSLFSLDINNFDGKNIKTTQGMFENCFSLTYLNINNFNPTQVITMKRMFYNCFDLKSLDLSNFNTSSTTKMEKMFAGCESLTHLNINNFNTSNVETMFKMFSGCISLISLNLSNFQVSKDLNNANYIGMLNSISPNLIFCVGDEFYDIIKSQIEEQDCIIRVRNCINNWSIKPYKIIDGSNKCIEQCNMTEYKYEYENKCYLSCPKGTTSIFNDNFLCEIFDENKYKSIEEKKKNITETKTEKNEEVEATSNEIRENVIIENIKTNDEENIETNKEENIETNERENIETYREENIETYGGENIETYRKENIDTYRKVNIDYDNYFKICKANIFFKKQCTPLNYISNMIDIIIQDIKAHLLDDLLEDVINENKIDINNIDNNIKYQITSPFNQKNKEYGNISIINLNECEIRLKEIYHLNQNETLIIFKYDYNIEGLLIPIVGYEVFHPITKEILDLNHCKNTTIDIINPVNIDEKKLYKHDPNNNYYKDKCNSFPNEYKVDMTLFDRKTEYNNKNLSLCAINCEFFNYDNQTNKVICKCEPQFNSSLITLDMIINKKKLLNSFIDIKKTTNIDVINCYKKLFSLDGLKSNIGSYILLFIFFISLIGLMTFISKGYNSLKETIKNLKNSIFQNKTISFAKKTTTIQMNNSLLPIRRNNNNSKTGRIHLKNSNVLRQQKNNNRNINKSINKSNNNNMLRSDIDLLSYKNKNKKQSKEKKVENKIKYTDSELNSFDYIKAAKFDKRSYLEYYISLIKTKHPLISSFCKNDNYNSISIKICLFLFSFSLSFTINSFFFTDVTMHKIYEDKGIFNFIYSLPKIIYSTIISFIISAIMKKLALSEDIILEINKEKKMNEIKQKAQKIGRIIIIKSFCFFVISFVLLGLFWFYIGCFCVVYPNTQIYLIKNTIISFSFSLVIPFIIYIFACIIRIKSLKKPGEFLYKLSKLLA